jgi:UDP-N-acetyl-2-amino-2-deoxyglucuronate dehydrogenase
LVIWQILENPSVPMTSPAPLGFAIVGVGMIAEFHAQALAHVEGARLVGVASRNFDNAHAFAEKHHVGFATGSIDELVARPDVDVVCITTPSGAHLEPALVAIRAGKHVVVEKPIEITSERADEMLRAAELAGVKVAPIFQARFGEGASTVKAALTAGRFGRLVLASAYVKWHRAASYYSGWKGTLSLDGGGALINQAIHAVDLLQWFAGMPEEVFCFKTRRVHLGIEAEDTASATLRFRNGALGTIEASTALYPGWQRRLEICGENGSVVLEDDHISRWDFREAQPVDDAIRSRKDSAVLGSGASAPNAISFKGHQFQLQNLVDSLRGGAPLAVDGREARKAVALIRALYDSAERGTAVKLS